ncbi:MAG TPA: family 16 glycosylhydrolase, partial [Streptosporangiaceae bacterium]
WTEVWSDTFNGPAGAGIDQRYWTYETGHGVFGNNEIETMTNSAGNVHLDGHGELDITAAGQGTSWTSGRIQTKRTFGAPAGGEMMVTASIRQPDPAGGMGYWPAFWMVGPGTWPETGEIDILEDVDARNEHSGTLHCGSLAHRSRDGTTDPCHGHAGLGSGLLPCAGCQQGYHTYTVVVDRRYAAGEQIRWYLDGHEFFSVREARVGRAAWHPAFDHGLAIIFDLAMGGGYPDAVCGCTGPTSQTTSGGTMSVRYVTVYRTTGNG